MHFAELSIAKHRLFLSYPLLSIRYYPFDMQNKYSLNLHQTQNLSKILGYYHLLALPV